MARKILTIAIENHHFSWENPLFLWSFSIANFWHNQRVPMILPLPGLWGYDATPQKRATSSFGATVHSLSLYIYIWVGQPPSTSQYIYVWVNTYRYIFSGLFTSINPSYDLGWTEGTRLLTHPHMYTYIRVGVNLLVNRFLSQPLPSVSKIWIMSCSWCR